MIGISLDIPEVACRGGIAWSPPLIGTTAPDIFGDFAAAHYSSGATRYSSFSTWLTGISSTYTRASNATYLQSGVIKTATSGTARFPTDLNGNALGIRLTGGGTNIILHSAVDASWTGSIGTLTAGAVPGPDGGATSAAKFIPTVSSNNHSIFLTSGTTYTAAAYTVSIFAKNNGYNFLVIDPTNGGPAGTANAVFNLTTGAAVTGAGAAASGTIQLANGWWYCWMTMTFSAGAKTNIFGALPTSSFAIYPGDGTSGISLFGAQAVLGASPLDYIPTVAATATQVADALTIPFSAASTLTAVAKATMDVFTSGGRLIGVGSGGLINQTDSTDAQTSNGTNSITAAVTAWTSANKIGVAGSGAARAIAANNAVATTDANALLAGAITNLYPMSDNGSNQSFGNLASIAAWNGLAASNAQLQALTI